MDVLRNQIIERKVLELVQSEAKFKDEPYAARQKRHGGDFDGGRRRRRRRNPGHHRETGRSRKGVGVGNCSCSCADVGAQYRAASQWSAGGDSWSLSDQADVSSTTARRVNLSRSTRTLGRVLVALDVCRPIRRILL